MCIPHYLYRNPKTRFVKRHAATSSSPIWLPNTHNSKEGFHTNRPQVTLPFTATLLLRDQGANLIAKGQFYKMHMWGMCLTPSSSRPALRPALGGSIRVSIFQGSILFPWGYCTPENPWHDRFLRPCVYRVYLFRFFGLKNKRCHILRSCEMRV